MTKQEYDHLYYLKNKDKIKTRVKKFVSENSEHVKKYKKEYFLKNKETINKYKKEYNITNKQHINKYKLSYQTKRIKEDTNYKLMCNLRSRLYKASKGLRKAGSAVRDLGCTIPELKEHLENQFQEGMSWNNHGKYGWHIDHIKPLSSFDLSNKTQFLEACHYTNLQPLWARDNLSKGSK